MAIGLSVTVSITIDTDMSETTLAGLLRTRSSIPATTSLLLPGRWAVLGLSCKARGRFSMVDVCSARVDVLYLEVGK